MSSRIGGKDNFTRSDCKTNAVFILDIVTVPQLFAEAMPLDEGTMDHEYVENVSGGSSRTICCTFAIVRYYRDYEVDDIRVPLWTMLLDYGTTIDVEQHEVEDHLDRYNNEWKELD